MQALYNSSQLIRALWGWPALSWPPVLLFLTSRCVVSCNFGLHQAPRLSGCCCPAFAACVALPVRGPHPLASNLVEQVLQQTTILRHHSYWTRWQEAALPPSRPVSWQQALCQHAGARCAAAVLSSSGPACSIVCLIRSNSDICGIQTLSAAAAVKLCTRGAACAAGLPRCQSSSSTCVMPHGQRTICTACSGA